MEYQDILKNYTYDEESLISYGFIKNKNDYFLSRPLNEQFLMEITLNRKKFIVRVIDKDTLDEYMPFRISTINGAFVQRIRDLVDEEIDRIIKKCFKDDKVLDELLEYVLKKYNTVPDYPFSDDSIVLRVNGKWYALIMEIDKSRIMDDRGKCLTMNLKIDKDKIPSIIDNKSIFKAYHMNKKYWITVLLDNTIDKNYLHSLVDESYSLVMK